MRSGARRATIAGRRARLHAPRLRRAANIARRMASRDPVNEALPPRHDGRAALGATRYGWPAAPSALQHPSSGVPADRKGAGTGTVHWLRAVGLGRSGVPVFLEIERRRETTSVQREVAENRNTGTGGGFRSVRETLSGSGSQNPTGTPERRELKRAHRLKPLNVDSGRARRARRRDRRRYARRQSEPLPTVKAPSATYPRGRSLFAADASAPVRRRKSSGTDPLTRIPSRSLRVVSRSSAGTSSYLASSRGNPRPPFFPRVLSLYAAHSSGAMLRTAEGCSRISLGARRCDGQEDRRCQCPSTTEPPTARASRC